MVSANVGPSITVPDPEEPFGSAVRARGLPSLEESLLSQVGATHVPGEEGRLPSRGPGGDPDPSERGPEWDRRSDLLPIGSVLFLAFAVRVLLVGRFPQVQADEGLWTTSTKNFLLFGDWFMDERSHLFLSPVFHLLSLVPFWVFGPSIEAARLVSVVAGTLSVALVYLLALRLFRDRSIALVSALLLALDPWAVITSRQAMTESVLLFFVLATAVLLLGRRREIILAGVCFALAILTKLNAGAMGIAFGGFLLLSPALDPDGGSWRERMGDAAIFGVVALGLAGLGYWAMAQIDPGRFMEVFSRELGGAHVGSEGAATGRLAIRPALIGGSVLELIRMNPFLVPLAAIGAAVAATRRRPAVVFIALWLVVGLGFPLLQVYQPIRYFFPALPALILLVAALLVALRQVAPRGDLKVIAATAFVLAFSGAYLSMNFVVNRGNAAAVVAEWARQNTDSDDVLLLAAYLATDPPNRAYAHDIVEHFPGGMDEAVQRLGVRYIIWDSAEWPSEMREELASRYREVQSWHFGAAFEVVR